MHDSAYTHEWQLHLRDNEKYCCVECFEHSWLRDRITEKNNDLGECDYCGRKQSPRIRVGVLSKSFENMCGLYGPADTFEEGDRLARLVQEDWAVFAEALVESDAYERLLTDILLAGRVYDEVPELSPTDLCCRKFRGPANTQPSIEFASETLSMFLQLLNDPANEALGFELFRVESPIQTGTEFRRARLGWDDKQEGEKRPWRGDDIGAPPVEKAQAGRANRKEQPVLYCAQDEQTAICEVRPVRGDFVSSAVFQAVRGLRVVDLVRQPSFPNPFIDKDLLFEITIRQMLTSSSKVLSEPVSRKANDDPAEYLPTQRLCEIIQSACFDGIRYVSAMNPNGSNLVLFDPNDAKFKESRLVKVNSVSVTYTDRVD